LSGFIRASTIRGQGQTKEKVIRITRQFSGNHSEAIDAIIQESTSRKGYHAYLRKHRDEIKTIFEYSGLQNLRILKFGLNVLELAYQYAKELAPRNEKLLSGLPSSLLPVTFEFQSGKAPLRTPGTYWLRTIRAEMEKAIATLKSLSPISKD
jgi:hypothetical protein